MKILVIEDHPSQLKLASHVLSAAGHDVANAVAAAPAFAAIKHERPEVILLDLALPDMDGFAIARALKASAETKGIPIVAVTSFPERFPRSAALAVGCDAYLVKPLNTRTLPAVLVDAGRMGAPCPP